MTGNTTGNATAYDACAGKGPVRGAICNVIENAKQRVLGGALTATQNLARSTLEVILHRPVPSRGGELAVFRPPTNQPLAGAYRGWTTVGLPLGFMVWVLGVGVALASRFRPSAGFAAQGFRIEQQLVRNLLLVVGSWWVGAFVLHLANGLILAVAPRGDQLLTGPQSGVGSILATGGLAALLWAATAAVVTILFAATVLAYFICLTFLEFLPVFSALMLFDTGGVLGTIGWFGQKGWDIFVRAAFFPLPAALVLGAGTFVAGGSMGFVERAVSVGGFAAVAGTLAFAVVMFVTQLAALLASLWMLMGSRATGTATGVIAGLGGAAMYARAKAGARRVADKASVAGVGTGASGAGAATDVTAGAGAVTDPLAGAAVGRGGDGGPGGILGGGRGTGEPAGALGAGTGGDDAGGLAPVGVPTGGRPGRARTSTESATGARRGTSAGDTGSGDPVVVERESDLPGGQDYQPGYLSSGEFQPVKPRGRNREMLVREHDRFAERYDSEGDHSGIFLRGEDDGRLYDASPVAGEDWGLSVSEEAGVSRDDVYDARGQGGDSP